MKSLLFITTHNLATNPRVVKEIELALHHNYNVTVVCCGFDNWSKANNEIIKQRLLPLVNYVEISATRSPFVPWLLSTCMYQAAALLLRCFPANSLLLSVNSNKRSWLILQYLKKIQHPIDLAIAHNPGSFYPAMRFAKTNKIPFGIDLEDYHPGETTQLSEAARFKTLNKNMLPLADYVSAASPLILEYSKADLSRPLQNELLLLNYFDKEEFLPPVHQETAVLSLVWFSQNISWGRGLEEIIPAIKNNPQFILHLYGHADVPFCAEWITGADNILLHPALPQEALHQQLSKYDVGLALEKPASNLNRDLCITNKILAYYQSGLYILASNTSAQDEFITAHPEHGMLGELTTAQLLQALQQLSATRDAIRQHAAQRYQKAAAQHWEKASLPLLNTWKQLLN